MPSLASHALHVHGAQTYVWETPQNASWKWGDRRMELAAYFLREPHQNLSSPTSVKERKRSWSWAEGWTKWRAKVQELGMWALLRDLSSMGKEEKNMAERGAGPLCVFCMFKMQASLQQQKVKKERKEANKTVSERPQNSLISHSAYSKASFSDLSHPQTSIPLWAVETESLISHRLDHNRQIGVPGLSVSTPKFSSFIPVHIRISPFPLELPPQSLLPPHFFCVSTLCHLDRKSPKQSCGGQSS